MRLIAALRYRPFRKVIAISEAIARELRDRGVEEERLAIIRSAVDVERFEQRADCAEFRRQYGVPDDALLIAAAGQLIPRKGHRYLLQAAAELRAEQPGLRVLIFGDGYLRNQLQAQAESLGVADVVTLAGFREDLDDYVGCFDVFVHPALAEGLGVAALKASAAGVPGDSRRPSLTARPASWCRRKMPPRCARRSQRCWMTRPCGTASAARGGKECRSTFRSLRFAEKLVGHGQ